MGRFWATRRPVSPLTVAKRDNRDDPYGKVHNDLERLGGFDLEVRARKGLHGLGLPERLDNMLALRKAAASSNRSSENQSGENRA